MPNEIMLFAVSVGISVASFTDVTRFKVYNLLTFPLMLSAFVFHTLNAGIGGLGLSLAGCFLALGILLAPYLLGGLGAGDVKFMMALGAWIGPNLVLPTVLIGSLAVTAYFFASVYRQRGWRSLFDEAQLLLARLSMLGKHFARNDSYENVSMAARDKESKNHSRLIPFSAMMSLGFVFTIFAKWALKF